MALRSAYHLYHAHGTLWCAGGLADQPALWEAAISHQAGVAAEIQRVEHERRVAEWNRRQA